jgi:hypothetical protein
MLSNDGETIISVMIWGVNDAVPDLRTVTIYRHGKLLKGFTKAEITGCDPEQARCELALRHRYSIVDWAASKAEPDYPKVYKSGVTAEDIFVSENAVRPHGDSLYLIDSKRVVHLINVRTATLSAPIAFKYFYEQFKNKPVPQLTTIRKFEGRYPPDDGMFPNLKNGDTTGFALARHLHKKAARSWQGENKFRMYSIKIGAYINRNGDINIEKLEADKGLPLDSIRAFLSNQKYDMSFLPQEFDRWYFDRFYWYFRNPDDAAAMQEKQQEIREQALARERRMTQDSISGAYIPQNLQDCFTELDKLIPALSKKEIVKTQTDMVLYHHTLGMGIRNRFGLWGGSRLLAYFQSRFPADGYSNDPDRLSGIIMDSYQAWLQGDKLAAEKWEKEHPVLNK